MKKFLITIGILFVAALATKDTIDRFNELNKVTINTPSQLEMRTPSNQNPGQRQRDFKTERLRDKQSNPSYNTNPNNNANNFDNFNRNRDRNNIRQYLQKRTNNSSNISPKFNGEH